MKNIIYLLLISLSILSCSKNDDSNDSLENPILGEWNLIKITSDGTYNPTQIDYSDKSIIYNFTPFFRYDTPGSGYELIISGGENSGYPNGRYEYFFREDYLEPGPWGEDDQKVLLVSINGSKYSYNLTGGIMTLSQSSYIIGGSDFIFEKVK
tara:strand:- start:6158 stop:6616 length:459 start_codon:yes stop_codon:yes gene_type:complete